MRIQAAVRFLSCWHSEVARLQHQLTEIRQELIRPHALTNDRLHYEWNRTMVDIDQLSEMCDGSDPEGQSKDIRSLKDTANEIESLYQKINSPLMET